jgi:hypothetical protein
MRFVSVLAAMAALWIQPAMAATTLTFEGTDRAVYDQPFVVDGYLVQNPFMASNPPPGVGGFRYRLETVDSSQVNFSGFGNGTGVLFGVGSFDFFNVAISEVGGGPFTLTSFDIAQSGHHSGFPPGPLVFNAAGYLNNNEIWRISGPLGQFTTYAGSSVPVDNVRFFGGRCCSETGILLDNIVLNSLTSAVPEPSTWAMMLLGFGFVGAAMRRRYNPRQIGTKGTQPGLGGGRSPTMSNATINRKPSLVISSPRYRGLWG